MSRLFFGNFDFEHQLVDPHAGPLPPRLERINRELAGGWCPLAEPGDRIWLPGDLETEFVPPLCELGMAAPRFVGPGEPANNITRLVPWGWSPTVAAWGSAHEYQLDAPPQAAVRMANSRRFSFELEQRWQVGLEGSSLVHDMAELVGALRELPQGDTRWVLKSEFGMSARERLLGTGRDLADATRNWAKSKLACGLTLVLEPWVERIAEVGLQFEVPRPRSAAGPSGSGDDPPQLLGVVPLLSDRQGQYRGSRMPGATLDDSWQPAVSLAYRSAQEIQRLGYYGPLGIDAMLYRGADGRPLLRPLQDINARFTMGRLALAWRDRLRLDEPSSWLHVNWNTDQSKSPQEWFAKAAARLPQAARLLRTSPFYIDGEHTNHGSLLVSAPTLDELYAAEWNLFEKF